MRTKKLIDTIDISTLLVSGGIFSKIYAYDQTLQDKLFPWLDSTYALVLDKDYYLSHSADKWISKTFFRFRELEDDGKIADALGELAKIIESKFALRWNKIYDAINTDYSPLENYDMEQTETPDITRTKATNTNLTTTTGKDTDLTEEKKVKSDITTSTTNDIVDNDVYGFNSSTPVPNNKSTRNGSVTVSGDDTKNVETIHTTGDGTKNVETVTVTGDEDDNVETETESGTRGLTRHGNIGVTTSQQMLQSEIDLRNNFNFMNQLMDDVDSILCLLVY